MDRDKLIQRIKYIRNESNSAEEMGYSLDSLLDDITNGELNKEPCRDCSNYQRKNQSFYRFHGEKTYDFCPDCGKEL